MHSLQKKHGELCVDEVPRTSMDLNLKKVASILALSPTKTEMASLQKQIRRLLPHFAQTFFSPRWTGMANWLINHLNFSSGSWCLLKQGMSDDS